MKYQQLFLKSVLLALLAAFSLSCNNSKQQKFTVTDVPDPKQSGGGYVSNPDHLISDSAVNVLNAQLAELDNAGKVQIAIVALHSIGANESRDFAHQLFNHWKLGRKETNNGLLMLMVEDDHKLVFETGVGIEADMPDIICFRIQQEYMIPRIKEHNNDIAFIDGAHAVSSLFYNGNYAFDNLPDAPAQQTDASLLATDTSGTRLTTDQGLEYVKTGHLPGEEQPPAAAAGFSLASPDNRMGDFSFWTIIACLVISALMMRFFFGKKIKAKKAGADVEPVSVRSLPNEFLRPRWFGLLLIHLAALSVMGYLVVKKYADVGVMKTLLIYYIVWVVFMHVAILIIALRAAIALKAVNRHEKWLRLEMLRRSLHPAGYIFPLPFLLFYLRWLKSHLNHLRNDPYDCQHCSKPMHKLDEKADDHYLDKAQVLEERLESVDYDVWRCDACDTQLVLNYTNMQTTYTDCPSCAHKTYQCQKTKTQKKATTYTAGWGVRTYVCAACAYTHDYTFEIPKISTSSSSSSNSSFSSSSDWGGGSSGGGGASSSW
ncbi:uncharacterized protein CLV51_10229 [Chitinophaga niastensis]|uniref:TPM domain-containing protein n=1 Tax=Chitinophaga niastensis TaxID=536980 RepID=A0A2P8HLT5_CHINA|nr:TPM domain-containing protein [Chitinophaga niastensis]PSL47184.1 uncharacterized protein CLV51_10229 [Chitinophaga niastensis]